jgi:redox-sensitive bicupin YhaK (pirin superfamily)
MEIITYMISGALEHKDSMGNRDIIRPGEIQHMSAGTEIQHSEYNASDSEADHVLQIWIEQEKTEL